MTCSKHSESNVSTATGPYMDVLASFRSVCMCPAPSVARLQQRGFRRGARSAFPCNGRQQSPRIVPTYRHFRSSSTNRWVLWTTSRASSLVTVWFSLVSIPRNFACDTYRLPLRTAVPPTPTLRAHRPSGARPTAKERQGLGRRRPRQPPQAEGDAALSARPTR